MYIKTFIKLNVRFENWGIFHGVNQWTLLSFSWGVFDHVTPTEQSCTSRNMSWVIAYDVKYKAPSLQKNWGKMIKKERRKRKRERNP